MKATELRIGNYILYKIVDRTDERNEWFSLDTIDATDLQILSKKDEMNKDYQPIPLTEEWLLKFGFTLYNKENPIMFKGVVFIEQRQKTLIGTQFFTFYFEGNRIKIQYVHQLQNLYFALTREELTFKLE